MRLPLASLEIFEAIAREGSLRAAADRLGLQPSTVSHQLKTLEAQLGTALFIRTTRSISLTEAGRALQHGTGPAFDQLTNAVESARTTGHVARGTLRLAMSDFVFRLLVQPALTSFRDAHPEITLEFSTTDAFVDLLDQELHAGFRLGGRIEQDMVAVRLTGPLPMAVMASPAYLARFGTPEHPRDLLDHACIRYRFQSSRRMDSWAFEVEGSPLEVDVTGPFIGNTLPALEDMACDGHGLIMTFKDYCKDSLSEGRLQTVLNGWVADVPGIYIYFPREYRQMLTLRLLLEHLKTFHGSVA